MQALLQTKIAEHIKNTTTVQRISDGLYVTLSNNTFFVVQNKEAVPAYSNEEIPHISYSSNDTVGDIVDKVRNQQIIQKYHCSEYAIAMVMELFTHYSIDVIMKCCGIVLFCDTIPVLCLRNGEYVRLSTDENEQNLENQLIVTMDLRHIERTINVKCKQVADVIESSMHDSISSRPSNTNNTTIYTLSGIILGMLALLTITELRRQ
ncbi:Hypothetical protein HVR_LOCUS1150 [uncultured virus]|nr:Hypothetical protein HVR_LOCUS1150 [uncultured virus]